ncbi:MAG: hypothetical protein LLG93_10310, partial [Deltaproteobacteria bacterium]|nr:hypothetical protein [Deltaproteobacteria bacterium]
MERNTVQENGTHPAAKPAEVMARAREAAGLLAEVMERKTRRVTLGGQRYLEFEDWQVLAGLTGISVQVEWTRSVPGEVVGFEARAVARDANGVEVSSGEACCLGDESHWRDQPLFMRRSMAQTRACAKALRNHLAWVAVLAGFGPTPAEEIQEVPGVQVEIAPEEDRQTPAPIAARATVSPVAAQELASPVAARESVKAEPDLDKPSASVVEERPAKSENPAEPTAPIAEAPAAPAVGVSAATAEPSAPPLPSPWLPGRADLRQLYGLAKR